MPGSLAEVFCSLGCDVMDVGDLGMR